MTPFGMLVVHLLVSFKNWVWQDGIARDFHERPEIVQSELKLRKWKPIDSTYNRSEDKTSVENIYFLLLFSFTIKPHKVIKLICYKREDKLANHGARNVMQQRQEFLSRFCESNTSDLISLVILRSRLVFTTFH